MVFRRCRNIVVVDGSQDEPYSFEDLGNAVRKIRVDLGIAIEFPEGIPIYGPRDLGNRYCALGNIRYDRADPPGPQGRLLYIKACLNGTEPEDVLHYASLDPSFPQQGTEQLWFNESQFESYRRLGQHIMERITSHAPNRPVGSIIDDVFARAEAYIKDATPIEYTRWPKPLKTSGTLKGVFGGTQVELDADMRHR
jgi:hypothetical protein